MTHSKGSSEEYIKFGLIFPWPSKCNAGLHNSPGCDTKRQKPSWQMLTKIRPNSHYHASIYASNFNYSRSGLIESQYIDYNETVPLPTLVRKKMKILAEKLSPWNFNKSSGRADRDHDSIVAIYCCNQNLYVSLLWLNGREKFLPGWQMQ